MEITALFIILIFSSGLTVSKLSSIIITCDCSSSLLSGFSVLSNGLGTLDLEVETTKLEIGDTTLEVHYKMIVDKESVSEFEFLLEYI